jgi:hypothetical protein
MSRAPFKDVSELGRQEANFASVDDEYSVFDDEHSTFNDENSTLSDKGSREWLPCDCTSNGNGGD